MTSRLRDAGQQVVLQSRALSAFQAVETISRRASVLWEPPLAELPPAEPPSEPHALSPLYTAEYAVLRAIQKTIPLFTTPALAIHYCVSEEVLTLVLAASVWVVSLPSGASLVAFVTFNNLANGIVKWAVQRPRPPWHTSQRVRNVRSAWEKDLSFPSGHTQFFSGLLVCAATLAHPDGSWLGVALVGGLLAGLSRNYLGVHFASDTLCGLLLGAALGAAWATHDPYATMLHAAPATSVAVATAFVGAAVGALALVRWAVPDVPPAQLAAWHANAVASLPLSIQERLRLGDEAAVSKYRFKTRALESYAPSIASSWTVLALAGAAGAHLPPAALQPPASAGAAAWLSLVGAAGLVVIGAAMLLVHKGAALGGGALKLLTFVLVAAWVCGGAQYVVYGSA